MFRSIISFTAGIYVAQRFRDQVPDITRIVDGVSQDIQNKLAEYNKRDPGIDSSHSQATQTNIDYNKRDQSIDYNKPTAKEISNIAMPTKSAQPVQTVETYSNSYWWWPGPKK